MGLIARLVAALIVTNLKLGLSSLLADCCQWEDSNSLEDRVEKSEEIEGKCVISGEGDRAGNETDRARVPVGIIYTGDVKKDKALVPLLHTISAFETDLSLRPIYILQNYQVNSSISALVVANAQVQLCVYFQSQEIGTFRSYLAFIIQWLTTGLQPSSLCSEPFAPALPSPLDKYLSTFSGPGFLLANRYLPTSLSPTELLSQLCPQYLNQSQSSNKPARALDVECSPNCTAEKYQSSLCFPTCNVPECSYQNWTCACAVGCSPSLLTNEVCDQECNTEACGFDNDSCLEYVPYTDPNQSSNVEVAWAKWIIVSLSLLTTRYFLPSSFLAITLYCYIKKRIKRRRYAVRDLNRVNVTASVSPMIVALDSDPVLSGRIVDLLGKRMFSREIVVFGEAMCVVCLAE